MVIPKRIYEQVGGCPAGVLYGEDADLWARIALKFPMALSGEAGAKYHLEAADRVRAGQLYLDKEAVVMTLEAALEKGEGNPDMVCAVTRYISKMELTRAIRFMLSGKRKEALIIIFSRDIRFFNSKEVLILILSILPTRRCRFIWDKTLQIYNGNLIET